MQSSGFQRPLAGDTCAWAYCAQPKVFDFQKSRWASPSYYFSLAFPRSLNYLGIFSTEVGICDFFCSAGGMHYGPRKSITLGQI
jgi:hypothetical protein